MAGLTPYFDFAVYLHGDLPICGVVFTEKNVGWSEICQIMCLSRFCGPFSSRIMSQMPLTPFLAKLNIS